MIATESKVCLNKEALIRDLDEFIEQCRLKIRSGGSVREEDNGQEVHTWADRLWSAEYIKGGIDCGCYDVIAGAKVE